jgi:hypothetical protein
MQLLQGTIVVAARHRRCCCWKKMLLNAIEFITLDTTALDTADVVAGTADVVVGYS